MESDARGVRQRKMWLDGAKEYEVLVCPDGIDWFGTSARKNYGGGANHLV